MPKTKHKKAFEKVLNGTKINQAMVEVGYAPSTAKSTGKLTRTKGWKELMEKHLPDNLLAKKHREGLNASTKKPHLIDRDDKGRPIYDYIPEDDFSTRHKYLDSAYKLKKRYETDVTPVSATLVQIVINPLNGEDRSKSDRQTTQSVASPE